MASKNKWGGAPTDKCVGCAKTVYPAEKLVMEGQIWHIECLRCTECSKKLTGANFGGFMPPDNKPYCKIHFDRIIISSGKGGASSTAAWTPKETSGEESASSSGKFGSRPTDRCELCSKIVYPAEKFSIEGRIFHTGCLKCKECSKQLGGSNWGGFLENDPYCKIHFDRIIISSGKGGISSVAEWTPKESSGGDSGDRPKSKYGGAPSEKCEKCGKTVYPAERLNMEGRVFHHGCLSCGECGKKLTGANFGGFVAPQEGETEEKVFCTVHLKQLVSRLGDSTKLSGAGTGGWTPKESSGSTGDRPKSKYGTQNHEKCVKCAKTVYPAEKISMEGRIYHGQCLRCVECNKALTGANWGAFLPPQFDPYCKTHYTQLVMARGDSTSLSGTGATGL